MADEHRAGTGRDRPLESRDTAAVPPVGPGVLSPGIQLVIDVYQHRKSLFPAEAEHPQRVGIIVHHPQFQLAAHPHAPGVDGESQPVHGVGPPGIGRVTRYEAGGIFFAERRQRENEMGPPSSGSGFTWAYSGSHSSRGASQLRIQVLSMRYRSMFATNRSKEYPYQSDGCGSR